MSDNKEVKFKGVVVRKMFESDSGFRIYAVDVNKEEYPFVKLTVYKNAVIKGDLPELTEGLEYEITATEENSKRGYAYIVSKIKMEAPANQEDMYVFLQEILTPKQASVLYEVYPDIVQMVIEDKTDEVDLSKLHGIGEYTFNKIRDKIKLNFCVADLVVEFGGYLTMSTIYKLYNKYTSIEVLRDRLGKDPYKCLCSISGIGFKKADAILLDMERASKENVKNGKKPIINFEGDLRTSEQRCLACVLYMLQENEENGNTKDNMANLRKRCLEIAPQCIDHFQKVIQDWRIYYDKDTMDIAFVNTMNMEKDIADAIKYGLSIKKKWDFDWRKYKQAGEYDLSDEQLELLHSVCENNVTILSGAGGCGKSASTEALIRMLKDNYKSFIFAAPTGKAAKVLSGFSGVNVTTIHRALGYNPTNGWAYNSDNKLDCDVLLLDEMSMVSVSLMWRVIDAIDFDKTKLVMVGDPNQLPSIQAGNLLHDFLTSKKIPTVMLTKVFRYGSGGILTAATDIRNGRKYLSSDCEKITELGDDKGYTFIKSNDDSIIKDVSALYKKLITVGVDGQIYKPKDIAVLTAYNKGDYGTIALNKILQKIANKNYGSENHIEYGETTYYVGDIVMQCANDYEAEIYDPSGQNKQTAFVANGESAVVKMIGKNFMVNDFDGIDIKQYKSDLSDLSHSYSYSLHKSQGATVKVVILITPRSHIYMNSSGLLYVGVTRASEKCFHFGLPSTVNMAMKVKENYNRHTFMQEMLVD